MDILRLSKEGGGVATCVVTCVFAMPSWFEDFGVVLCCMAVVFPGLTRLRLGLERVSKSGDNYSSLGNFHKGCPTFGMDGWSGKKGQNRTRQVGWLFKKGRPIF